MLHPTSWTLRVQCETIKLIGVLPFVAWAIVAARRSTAPTDAQVIACLVAFNGVLCHLSIALQSTGSHVWRAVDMGCNAALIVYINVRSQWVWTGAVTLVALAAWQSSRRSNSLANACTHVVLVQWTLLLCLAKYHPAESSHGGQGWATEPRPSTSALHAVTFQ
jgi:hypothetical protein